ncbi:MAG TPA: hypothetical protein V6C72_04995 [Chroococcales cyanobacterium]
MAIAEERLPIPVELVEASDHQDGSPTIRIDGNVIHSIKHHYEDLRDSLSRRWRELNHDPLAST